MSIRVKSVVDLSDPPVLVYRREHNIAMMVYFHSYLTIVHELWIIGVIKTRIMGWAGHVVRMGNRRGLYRVFCEET
jgi:hypothetical protein